MEHRVWHLDSVDLFEILCPYKLNSYLHTHPLRVYSKGDFVFLPHDPADGMYLIAEGKVKVGFYDEEGNEHVLAFLGRGELLGEIAYLDGQRRRDFAQCVCDGTSVCYMTAEKARELSRDYVPFALEIHKKIAHGYRRMERKLEILFFKDTGKRLEELLKDLELACGTRTGGWVHHGLTQQEMASLIGTSRKTVSLILKRFGMLGRLEARHGRFRWRHAGAG
ncbi:MAG: Crp/Fnr family transcriptional regulator [Bacteroidia bacterium]|nr:Crp/Fnr family transcriptional regulator [Bacteroidia bacterium]